MILFGSICLFYTILADVSASLVHELSLDDMGILVPVSGPGSRQREYVLSNRDTMYLIGDTDKSESRKWHGFLQKGWNLLTNVWLDTSPSTATSRQDLLYSVVYPHKVTHVFQSFNETLFVPEIEDALVVTYTFGKNKVGSQTSKLSKSSRHNHHHPVTTTSQNNTLSSVYFRPTFGFRKDWESTVSAVEVLTMNLNNTLLVRSTSATYKGNYTYMGFYSPQFQGHVNQKPRFVNRTYDRDAYRHDIGPERYVYEFGSMKLDLDQEESSARLLCIAGSSAEDVISKMKRLSAQLESNEIDHRMTTRLSKVVNRVRIQTANPDDRLSLSWALASLDALTMNVQGPGIFAGLPWFNNYWGRDTFISLTGAFLKSGQFSSAKQILLNMGRNQNTNKTSQAYGRIPNFIPDPGLVPRQPNSYETADGTAWWVRALWMLMEHEGVDMNFLKEVWPMVQVSLSGEMSRMDEHGFLKHEPRGTWMDALYNGKTITPRGNRAAEVQALFYTELDIASRIASLMNDTVSRDTYHSVMIKLRTNFIRSFFSGKNSSTNGYFYDHLNPDGTPDLQHRPNVMYLVTIPLSDNPLVPSHLANVIMEDILANNLIAPYGVRTLSPKDREYRSTHDETGQNHDFSYHNGDVWPFLTGPMVEASMLASRRRQPLGQPRKTYIKLARDLLLASQTRLLDIDTVGAIEEIADGGNASWNAAVDYRQPETRALLLNSASRACLSQTWSMAEYVRAMIESGLGLSLQMTQSRVVLNHAPILEGDSLAVQVPIGSMSISSTSSEGPQRQLSVSWKKIPGVEKLYLVTMRLNNPEITEHFGHAIAPRLPISVNLTSPGSWTVFIPQAKIIDKSNAVPSANASSVSNSEVQHVEVPWDVSTTPLWQGTIQFL